MSDTLIGKVKDAHGLKGEIYVLVFSKDVSWRKKLKTLKLKTASDVRQFEVGSQKVHKDGLIVKLKGIEDRNQSEALKGSEVYIPQELMISQKGETIFLSEVLGFVVFLKDQCVGHVENFSSNGPQDIVVIRNEDILFEVPFVKEFILNIDFQEKKLFMDFPPELMDLDKI